MAYPRQQQKGYPPQQSGPPPPKPYPAHPAYPQMPPQAGMVPPPGYAVPPPGSAAPPPYTPYPTQQPTFHQQPVTYVAVQPMQQAAYDDGARFNGVSRPNVPPPPPGVMPNAAQVAAAQGQPVYMQQRNADWLSGGSGAGYTFW